MLKTERYGKERREMFCFDIMNCRIRQTKELEAESSRAAEKLKDLESAADKLQDGLKTAICEFAEKDKKIVKEKKTSE